MPSSRFVLAIALLLLGTAAQAQDPASTGQVYGPEPAEQVNGPQPKPVAPAVPAVPVTPVTPALPMVPVTPVAPALPAVPVTPAMSLPSGSETAGPMPLVPYTVPAIPASASPVPTMSVPAMPAPALPTPAVLPVPQAAVTNAVWNVLQSGCQLLRNGEAVQALPLIQQFIAANPLEPEGYFWQAVALDKLHEFDHALQAYSKALTESTKVGMDSAELRMNVGNVLLKQGKTSQAIVQYQRAAEVDPGLPLVQLNLGRALLAQNDTAGALACFQRCEALHFEPVQLPYYRAKALLLAGRPEEARQQVRQALAKLPLETNDGVKEKIKQEFAELLKTQRDAAFSPR
jgi:tetratricopeptide (TPR) repeat protein